MDGDKMTIPQVLEATENLLGGIAVPRYLNDQVGVPIDHAISNIRLCIDAYYAAEMKEQEAAETGGNADGGAEDGNDHAE